MALYVAPEKIIELEGIEPTTPDFMKIPVEDVFDWANILGCLNEAYGWPNGERYMGYLALFRSIRLPEADTALLEHHDDLAYEEAKKSGGLLTYHKGDLDKYGRCASFCVWGSEEEAYRATRGAAHRAAAALVGKMYKPYRLDLRVIAWQDGVVEFSLPNSAAHQG